MSGYGGERASSQTADFGQHAEDFRKYGFLRRVDGVISRTAMEAEIFPKYEELKRFIENSQDLNWSDVRFDSHLLLPWLYDLVINSQALQNLAKALLLEGDEGDADMPIVVWGTDFCVKKAGGPEYFSWHQDSTYSGWAGGQPKPHGVTLWLAFTDVSGQAPQPTPVSHIEGGRTLKAGERSLETCV